jgi:PPP family 3-phenylpropionic acid transporter
MWLKGNTVGKERAISFFFYMLSFAAVAFYMPNFVLFYQGLGFNGIQIGILAGIAPLITLLGAPLWTGLADKKRRHRLIMSLVLLATVLIATIFPRAQTFIPVVVLVGLFAIFSAPIPAFADSATMFMLAGRKELYGRVRLGGTIGFGLAAILSSLLILSYGISWVFWGYAVMMFLAFIVSQRFVYGTREENESLKWDPRWVLTNRRWMLFLVMAFIGGVAFTTINNYMLPYMQELGASRMTMGLALTISTLGELPVLFFSNLLVKRFKAYGLFIFGLLMTGVRLLLFAVFNFTAGILFFQLLNGLTFPLMWVAGVTYADENAPTGMKSTAQGLFGAMILGIGAAVGGMCGGLMLESIGGRNMYWIFGSLVLVCVGVITVFERAERGREVRNII